MKFNLIKYCEFDKFAQKSYDVIHGTTQDDNLGDVCEADFTKLDQADLIVGGSPCQDFSIAGNKKGSAFTCLDCNAIYNPIEQHWSKRDKCPACDSENLEKTRSSLLIEYLRAIRENKPKFFIYENVKNIIGKANKPTFDLFRKELDEYGYSTYYQVLNAKNYGVPQNRERVFVVGIRNDVNKGFEFPEGFDSEIRLENILVPQVDSNFYIKNDRVEKLLNEINKYGNQMETPSEMFQGNYCLNSREGKVTRWGKIMPALNARDYKDPKVVTVPYPNEINQIGNISSSDSYGGNPQTGRIYDICGVSPTLNTCGGGQREVKVLQDMCVRKLVPKEYFRLMGFDDESFIRAAEVNSNSQLYKQAGNSIVVDCLYYIYKKLQEFYPDDFKEDLGLISLFSGIGAFEKGLERL